MRRIKIGIDGLAEYFFTRRIFDVNEAEVASAQPGQILAGNLEGLIRPRQLQPIGRFDVHLLLRLRAKSAADKSGEQSDDQIGRCTRKFHEKVLLVLEVLS